MAVEDALVLARCLRDVPGTADALAAYERLRRGRVERIVEQGRRNGSYKSVGPVRRMLRDAALPVILRAASRRDNQRWIYDYRVPETVR